jgi:predicted metal-dependent phosphoesterase TrpH
MLLPQSYRDKILDAQEGKNHLNDGWMSADLHVHSTCSHDVLPSPDFHPEAIYQAAMDKGLSFVSITDHDTMDAYDILGWDRENLVTGVEVSFRDLKRVGHTIHVNVWTLDKQQYQEIENIALYDQNIETFISYLKDQNLPYQYNHPFWFDSRDKPNYLAAAEIFELFPVIEYNMKRVRKKNLLALWLAAEYDKGIIAGTDTHIGRVGEAYTLAQGNTFRDYYNNIVVGKSLIVPQDLNVKNLNYEILTWIEVLFSLEEVLGEKTHFSGIKPVDAVINFFASNSYEDYPRTFTMFESFLRKFAKTGCLSYVYLLSQNLMANRIGRLLEIPDIA